VILATRANKMLVHKEVDGELATITSTGGPLVRKLKMVIMGGISAISRDARGKDGRSEDTDVSFAPTHCTTAESVATRNLFVIFAQF
jgi:hypothetical protein